MKFTILNAGFPMAVATDDDTEKSIAAYTPGMLIDRLRYLATSQHDNPEVAMMLGASAAMLESVIRVHYGKSMPEDAALDPYMAKSQDKPRATGGMIDPKRTQYTGGPELSGDGAILSEEVLKKMREAKE